MAKFGIALGSGPRGLGFESRHSDQIYKSTRRVGFFILRSRGIRTILCDADERRRRRLDGGELQFFHKEKCKRIPTLRLSIR